MSTDKFDYRKVDLDLEWTPLDGHNHLAFGLENCYRCKPIQGSNPCPSANFEFRIDVLVGSPSLEKLSKNPRAKQGVWQEIERDGIDVLASSKAKFDLLHQGASVEEVKDFEMTDEPIWRFRDRRIGRPPNVRRRHY